jgi:phosphoribosylformimino-5-aminoimidazole carboxamide ribotide isomerase
MILFPAIDLKEGNCVRLERGAIDKATVYSEDPGRQARAFMNIGFSWLHVVDLDGAIAGESKNTEAVEAILWCVANKMKVQLGGGIRDRACIDDWLEKGVTRVILGTAALRNPALVKEAARAQPGSIAVGVDARGGKVAVEGWAETSDVDVINLAKRFEDAGVAAIIHTDIDRDGILAGVNWRATIALAEAVSIPVIASGGVASLADIERLLDPDAAKLEGIVVGRAFYDGRIDPKEALKLLARASGGGSPS